MANNIYATLLSNASESYLFCFDTLLGTKSDEVYFSCLRAYALHTSEKGAYNKYKNKVAQDQNTEQGNFI